MTKMLVAVAALTGFVAYKRWEGEGGNVPAVATPSPAPQPRSSYPDSGSERRH